MSTLANYDDNIRWAKHTVELTYQVNDYLLTHEVEVGGNCRGFTIMETAIDSHADALYAAQGSNPELELKNPTGDSLLCAAFDMPPSCGDDDEPDLEEWLKLMCVSARIVKHEEEKK